jgi:hypothetical protein
VLLVQWKDLKEKNNSLSNFLCALQTTSTLPKVAKYILERKSLTFVLFGKLSSDPIEKRFGQYRQLAGANYFLSVRQFVESEKLIRLRSLVRFSQLSLGEVREVFEPTTLEQEDNSRQDSDTLLELLGSDSEDICHLSRTIPGSTRHLIWRP